MNTFRKGSDSFDTIECQTNPYGVDEIKASSCRVKRGHKLLKDKQDELMRQFIELIRKNNALREAVEGRLVAGMKSFVLAKATLEEAFIEELVAIPPQSVSLDLQEKNIMSVLRSRNAFHCEG